MSNIDLVEFYHNEILPRLPLDQVYSSLNPIDKGDRFDLSCPDCHEREAYVYKNFGILYCNRKNNCNFSTDPIKFINGGRQPMGPAWVETIKKLGAMANILVPDIKYSEKDQIKHATIIRKQDIRKSFQDITIRALNSDGYPSGREYLLNNRRLTLKQSNNYGLGYYPSTSYIKGELEKCGFSQKEISESGLINESWINRVVCPIRNLRGEINNFWARDVTDNQDRKKLLYMANEYGANLDIPFGLDQVSGSEVLAVEGVFDRLTLDAHGIKNVIALGGSTLTEKQAASIKSAKINTITLLLDNDQAGTTALSKIITKYINADFEIHIIPPKSLLDCKDPDEFVKKYGIASFNQNVLDQEIHSFEYIPVEIAKQYNKTGEFNTSEKIKAFEAAKRFEEKVNANRDRSIPLEAFWGKFVDETNISQEIIDQYLTQRQEEKARLESKSAIEDAMKLLSSIDTNDPETARNEIVKIVDELNNTSISSYNKPAITAASLLDEHDEMLAERWSREFIGLPQKTLPSLDSRLMGLRLFMLLAAAPNVGKSALSIQLGIDTLLSNQDTCLLFITFEMSTSEILSRVRCKLANIEWRHLMRGYFTKEEQDRLDYASVVLKKLGSRFEFLDAENYQAINFDFLKFKISDIKKRTGCQHVMVVIDYLQVWPIPDSIRKIHTSENDQDRWRIEQLKKIKQCLNEDPLLVISEARKPSGQTKWGSGLADIMGSSRGAYGPDVVFLLYPQDDKDLAAGFPSCGFNKVTKQHLDESIEKNGSIIRNFYAENNESIVTLCIEKGRDGMQKGSITTRYNFEKNTFEEFNWQAEAVRLANKYGFELQNNQGPVNEKKKRKTSSEAIKTESPFDTMV